MASNYFRGDAQDVAQVQTHTVAGTAAAAQVYTLTANRKEISYTADGADTNTTIAAALRELLAASTIPEFKLATWTVSTNVITATASTPGRPFTVTSAATGTGTLVASVTTASKGHWHWDDADNWSAGWIPQGACSAPVQSVPSAASGGSLSNGTTYYWVITAINANGETTASNERNLAITSPNLTAVLSWAQVSGATGYKIYRSTSTGSYGATSLVTTISSGSTLTYNDTGAALTSGTPAVSNTAVGDDVFIENVSTDILYGIDQNAIALVSLNIGASFTGKIGLKDQAAEGYTEYLEKSLKIRPGTLNIGYGVGPCSQFIRIDTGTAAAATVNVFGTGSPTDQISKALLLQGSHASNVLNTTQGSIGCAMYAGETSNYPTVRVGSESQPATDVDIFGGTGASWTTITQIGGNVEVNSNVTTWTKYGGTSVNYRTSTIGTLTQEGQGSHSWQSTGTITTGTFRGAGSYLDSSRDIRGKTITNSTFIGGAYFIDPSKSMTFTNPFTTDAASLLAVAQKTGLGSGQFNLQRS
jgi:hypothetical protein